MEAMKQWYQVWHHKDGYGITKVDVIKETPHFVTLKARQGRSFRTSKIRNHGFYTDNLETAKEFLRSKYRAVISDAKQEIATIEAMQPEEPIHYL